VTENMLDPREVPICEEIQARSYVKLIATHADFRSTPAQVFAEFMRGDYQCRRPIKPRAEGYLGPQPVRTLCCKATLCTCPWRVSECAVGYQTPTWNRVHTRLNNRDCDPLSTDWVDQMGNTTSYRPAGYDL
jgi:hypothetical protein